MDVNKVKVVSLVSDYENLASKQKNVLFRSDSCFQNAVPGVMCEEKRSCRELNGIWASKMYGLYLCERVGMSITNTALCLKTKASSVLFKKLPPTINGVAGGESKI